MIHGRSVLAIVPARGGSKGIVRKNVRPLLGKPLISWTIAEAQRSLYIDRLIVSTDDDEIAEVARSLGAEVPFKRSAQASSDEATMIEVLHHAFKNLPENYALAVALQPTSPLRLAEDIDGAIDMCLVRGAPTCATVGPSKPPHWIFTLAEDHTLRPVTSGEMVQRRQNAAPAYALNGAVYVGEVGRLRQQKTFQAPETVAFVMPAERSVDIDTEIDFIIAEALLTHRARQE